MGEGTEHCRQPAATVGRAPARLHHMSLSKAQGLISIQSLDNANVQLGTDVRPQDGQESSESGVTTTMLWACRRQGTPAPGNKDKKTWAHEHTQPGHVLLEETEWSLGSWDGTPQAPRRFSPCCPSYQSFHSLVELIFPCSQPEAEVRHPRAPDPLTFPGWYLAPSL